MIAEVYTIVWYIILYIKAIALYCKSFIWNHRHVGKYNYRQFFSQFLCIVMEIFLKISIYIL